MQLTCSTRTDGVLTLHTGRVLLLLCIGRNIGCHLWLQRNKDATFTCTLDRKSHRLIFTGLASWNDSSLQSSMLIKRETIDENFLSSGNISSEMAWLSLFSGKEQGETLESSAIASLLVALSHVQIVLVSRLLVCSAIATNWGLGLRGLFKFIHVCSFSTP